MITQKQLKELLSYDSNTGVFTWIKKTSNRAPVGNVAGYLNHDGYVYIKINNKIYSAHRLAWLFTNKAYPENMIDHINGNRSDNRICNLREATRVENAYNQKKQKNNTSGVKGVCWHKKHQKWNPRIIVNGKRKSLGLFDDLELAELVINEARQKYHGKYANNG